MLGLVRSAQQGKKIETTVVANGHGRGSEKEDRNRAPPQFL